MYNQVIEDLEGFRFSLLNKLERFHTEVKPENAEIWYIPAPYPIPRQKEVLEAATDGLGDSYIGNRPLTKSGLQDEYFSALDYLLKKEGKANAYLFVPPHLLESDFYGRNLHKPRVYDRGIKNSTRKLISKEIFDDEDIGREANSLGGFLTALLISAVIEERVSLEQLDTTPDSDNIYVEFSHLEQKQVLSDYFLHYLEVKPESAYWSLPNDARKRVYDYHCYQAYGLDHTKVVKWTQGVQALDENERKVFRGVALLYLATRESDRPDLSLAPIVPPMNQGRELVEDLKHAFNRLPDTPSEFKVGDLEEVAQYLSDHVGYLFLEPTDGTFTLPDQVLLEKHFVTPAREISEYVDRYEAKTKGYDDLVDVLCNFFEGILELGLFTSFGTVDEALQSSESEFSAILEEVLEKANSRQKSRIRDYDDLAVVREAFYSIEATEREIREAEVVNDLPRRISEVPEFLEKWCDHIQKENCPDYVNEAYVSAYDEFTDVVVESYSKVVEKESETKHISQLIGESNTPKIVFVIDSFGLTDVQLISDYLKTHPTQCEPVISNIPSYTPSAMTTIYTGLPPSSTGVYGWKPKLGDERYDFMRGGEDVCSFVTQSSLFEFDLVLDKQYANSQLTKFCSEISDIETHGITFDGLDGAIDSFAGTVSDIVDDPTRRKNRPIVCYLQRFDRMLHAERDKVRFDSYYLDLARFVDGIVTNLREAISGSPAEDADLVFTGDHGSLTRKEKSLITDYHPTSFSDRYLEDILGQRPKEIFSEIESGSKFRFGWTDRDIAELNFKLDDIEGIDTHIPKGTGTFDLPDIGIISRYDFTQTRRNSHGHHGGTSLSEMIVPELTYGSEQDG